MIRNRSKILTVFFFLLTFLAVSLSANPLYGEFWVRRDMMDIHAPGDNTRETEEFSDREKQEIETLLEDARWTFSGMIYGFGFSWTPASNAREVEEELSFEPLGRIPWGDPRMRTVAVEIEDGFIYIQLEYNPDVSQESRLRGWDSQAYPVATGAGEVRAVSSSRRDALEQGMKEALRAWLRAREFNRPREVTGRIALDTFPLTGLRANNLKASVAVRMDLDPLRHYSVD